MPYRLSGIATDFVVELQQFSAFQDQKAENDHEKTMKTVAIILRPSMRKRLFCMEKQRKEAGGEIRGRMTEDRRQMICGRKSARMMD